jgi:asparagine synthase (glutamine-hydrolysing)
MKLQLGLLHLDGRAATIDDWGNLLGQFAERSTETAGETTNGSLLMAYRGDRITREEDSEVQPLRHGPYILTWDGRLDNREELAERTGLRHYETLSDNQIVLNAYERLGDPVFSDLIGEFALILWCGRTRSLRFARSACGARTLYYVLTQDSLIWSSDFAHLVRITRVDLAVNDKYVVEYLVSQPATTTTPLRYVDVIPSNSVVHFQDGRVKSKRELWNPTRVSALRYRTDGEYEEHFREQMREAVKVRLRAKHPIFAELSGGLDSSTIVLLADEILRSQNRPPDELQTVSCVYEQSETCDELPFIQAVADKRGVDPLLVHEKEQRITLGLDDPRFTGLPNALHCFPGRYSTIAAHMRGYNARVLLTGRGGDHLFWSEADGTPIVADELRKANLLGAHAQCRRWSRAASAPYYDLLVNRAVPVAFESLWPRRSRYKKPEMPVWVHPRHAGMCLADNPDFDGYQTWRAAPSRRAQVFFLQHMFRYLGSGFLREFDELYISHPYSHRPLIEFCLGVPVSQFLRNGNTRSLMRRALKDLLPQKIVKRVSKGLVDETMARALRREWTNTGSLLNWQLCVRGYVTHAHLLESLTITRLGIVHHIGPLVRLFSFERWLRSLSNVRSDNMLGKVAFAHCTGFFLRFQQSVSGTATISGRHQSWWRKENHGIRNSSN